MVDPFDDQLRSHLQGSVPSNDEAAATLRMLGPSLRRARRRRQIGTAVARLAAVGLIVGAAAAAIDFSSADDRTTVIATAPTESFPGLPSDADNSTTSPSVTARTSELPTSSVQTDSSSDLPSAETSAPATTATPTTAQTTTVPATTASVPDGSSNTTAQQSSRESIDSSCGSIEVTVTGQQLSLTGVAADPGYGVEVKEDGPDKVEVSFEGPAGHCELRAEIKDGAFWSEVDEE